MSWIDTSNNPVDPRVHKYLLTELAKKKTLDNQSKLERIEKFVKNQHVLDIGVVEHDFSHIQSDRWQHRKIKEWSEKVVGVDVLKQEVDWLNKNGFDVRLVDATSETDFGEKFDRVVVGDVIEHVADPVKLLRFCARHLKQDGLVMVSTPNPFYWSFILRVFRENTFIANAEHVSWITPTMALEIGRRAGLELYKYYPGIEPPRSILKRIAKTVLSPFINKESEFYAPLYVYVYCAR